MELADHDAIDLVRSRTAEQEVLDMLDESESRWDSAGGFWLRRRTRPVVIVSRYDPDPPRALITHVPLTTQNRHSSYEVLIPKLPFLDAASVANVQGIGSIPTVRLERRLGKLSAPVRAEIRRAIVFALDLEGLQP